MAIRCQASVSQPSKPNGAYRRNLVSKLRERAFQHAKQVCQQRHTQECAIAWDLVNDYDHTLRKMNQVLEDPMETFCRTNPSDLECREYDL
jgi:hypothetical protein